MSVNEQNVANILHGELRKESDGDLSTLVFANFSGLGAASMRGRIHQGG